MGRTTRLAAIMLARPLAGSFNHWDRPSRAVGRDARGALPGKSGRAGRTRRIPEHAAMGEQCRGAEHAPRTRTDYSGTWYTSPVRSFDLTLVITSIS